MKRFVHGPDVHITVIVFPVCASAVVDTSITSISTSTGGLSASAFDVAFFADTGCSLWIQPICHTTLRKQEKSGIP